MTVWRSILVGALAAVVLVGGLAAPAAADDEVVAPEDPASGIVGVSSTGSGVDDSVVRLYAAVFGRAPDPVGLAWWVERYRRGERLDAIAATMASSPEFLRTYGDLDASGFVHQLYRNVLGRDADPGGHRHWTDELGSHRLSRGQVVTAFSQSAELVRLTATLPPEPPPPVVPAGSGSGRRIIYCVSCQHVWLVEDSGLLVRDYPVSGRANTPAAGTYQVFSKSPLAWAGYDGITMEYMVRYTWGRTLALGFHSIPSRPDGTFLQTEEELGQYRSGGCTRQRLEDARFLYEWAPVGTTVVVLR